VQKPFEAGRAEGRDRLMVLLRQVMIRAAKSAIRTIPPCTRQVCGIYTLHAILPRVLVILWMQAREVISHVLLD